MADLKRKLHSVDIDSLKSRTRPRLSEIGISPRQLQDTLEFFSNNNISVSNFIISLLLYTPDSEPLRHASEDAVKDVVSNLDNILQTFLLNNSLGGAILTWIHTTAAAVYKHEVRSLTEINVGWHFTASRAQAAQFSHFDMSSVMKSTALRAPLLWELFDQLFCVDGHSPPVQSESTLEELQFKKMW